MVVLQSYTPLVVAALSLALAGPVVASDLPGPVPARVERVVDGDTVRVAAEIWVGQTVSISVRLRGVDAPELFRPKCPAEKEKARAAKAFVEGFLAGGEVSLMEIEHDKYGGRVVARMENGDGEDAGAALIAAGLAVPYGADKPWCG